MKRINDTRQLKERIKKVAFTIYLVFLVAHISILVQMLNAYIILGWISSVSMVVIFEILFTVGTIVYIIWSIKNSKKMYKHAEHLRTLLYEERASNWRNKQIAESFREEYNATKRELLAANMMMVQIQLDQGCATDALKAENAESALKEDGAEDALKAENAGYACKEN